MVQQGIYQQKGYSWDNSWDNSWCRGYRLGWFMWNEMWIIGFKQQLLGGEIMDVFMGVTLVMKRGKLSWPSHRGLRLPEATFLHRFRTSEVSRLEPCLMASEQLCGDETKSIWTALLNQTGRPNNRLPMFHGEFPAISGFSGQNGDGLWHSSGTVGGPHPSFWRLQFPWLYHVIASKITPV